MQENEPLTPIRFKSSDVKHVWQQCHKLCGAVNSDWFRGRAPETVKTRIYGEETFEGSDHFWIVTIAFDEFAKLPHVAIADGVIEIPIFSKADFSNLVPDGATLL